MLKKTKTPIVGTKFVCILSKLIFMGGVGMKDTLMKVRLLKCEDGHKTIALTRYNPDLCEADVEFFVQSNGRMTRHRKCGSKLIVNRVVKGNGWVNHWDF
jgi:hypothetical protein